ncbi:hypothetical protein [Kitasatospora sp. GP82]|uniref:hypothetical protein n=1 Tax=Kitasatospora sp. GP82 TaxID=3035089 RepID=UPI0024763B39|nr:hypothetical protein [Kitasatospora sp. GP82]MDH6129571.1 hypothetical protein [Kitasatospora sp. GP82]
MPLSAPGVARLFTAGVTFNYPSGQSGTIGVNPSSSLNLPSGRVVACDPFTGLGPYGPGPFRVSRCRT